MIHELYLMSLRICGWSGTLWGFYERVAVNDSYTIVDTPCTCIVREGAGVGDPVASVNVTLFSSHDLRYRLRARPGQTQLADWNTTASAEPLL